MPNEKHYISADNYLQDIWRLAHAVAKSDYKVDALIVLWRGGAPVGVAMHEFLTQVGYQVKHLPLKCSSYTDIGKNDGEVQFVHPEVVLNYLEKTDNVLVVDDVFDTGKTAKAVLEKLDGVCKDVRFACVYWKKPQNQTEIEPDYFVKEIGTSWLVFPHEILGLSEDEIFQKDKKLYNLISECKENVEKA
jgi:hypoxanthine phosphoribosyltransferase